MLITLKAARINKGFTQKEAAKLLNVGSATLQRWETGSSMPSVTDIKNIEQLYEIQFKNILFNA